MSGVHISPVVAIQPDRSAWENVSKPHTGTSALGNVEHAWDAQTICDGQEAFEAASALSAHRYDVAPPKS